jgi:hypothetical protein
MALQMLWQKHPQGPQASGWRWSGAGAEDGGVSRSPQPLRYPHAQQWEQLALQVLRQKRFKRNLRSLTRRSSTDRNRLHRRHRRRDRNQRKPLRPASL